MTILNKPYEEANKILDEIINKRRSIRKFKKEVPPKEIIEDIIKSGLMAPYAGISGIPANEIRRFFVLSKDSENMIKANEIIMSQLKSNAKRLNLAMVFVPYIRNNGKAFVKNVVTTQAFTNPQLCATVVSWSH